VALVRVPVESLEEDVVPIADVLHRVYGSINPFAAEEKAKELAGGKKGSHGYPSVTKLAPSAHALTT
jgi:hypothetical protein